MTGPEYIAPNSLDESLELKQLHGDKARVIAGGTDLILRMRDQVYSPHILIDLRDISLDHITVHDEEMRIGAYVSLSQILEDSSLASSFPALAEACLPFAGPPIRNRATIGGNIINASPAADLVPSLLAYDARIVLSSTAGDRVLALEDFFTGPGQSVLRSDEVLTQISLPFMPAATAASFIKIGQRRSMAISIVNICTRLSLDTGGSVSAARIALGSVAPTPLRALRAEAILEGKNISDEQIDEAAKTAGSEVAPISDVRSSSEYRLKMTKVLVRRALMKCRDELFKGEASG